MRKPVPLFAVKAQLAGLVQAAEAGEGVPVSRHGQQQGHRSHGCEVPLA